MKTKFALDLTWVRHKIVGGTEFFVNNLIQGFLDTDYDFEITFLTALDNNYLFGKYTSDDRIKILKTPVKSSLVARRIIWQNLFLSRLLIKNNIFLCLEPVYSKPILGTRKIKFVTVIHDLEALHYPENHSFITNLWLRISWYNSVKTSKHIISISDFVKKDILSKYNIREFKVTTIFDPVIINIEEHVEFKKISSKYCIEKGNYYYTVSKLNIHKNLTTLIKTFGEIKKNKISNIPCKLVISGVNGGMKEQLLKIAEEYSILDEIVLTGFVDNSVRNTLYTNAKAFLFPSIFEGFGMPPIEAICSNTPVITTKMACIPEITQNIANYVENPYSPDDWIYSMINMHNKNHLFDKDRYLPKNIAKKYISVLKKVQFGVKDD